MSIVVICKGKAEWFAAIADAKLYGAGKANWVVEWYGPDTEAQADETVAGPPVTITNLDSVGPNGYIVIGYSKSMGPNPETKAPTV